MAVDSAVAWQAGDLTAAATTAAPPVLTLIGDQTVLELTDYSLHLSTQSTLPVVYSMMLGNGFNPGSLPTLSPGGYFSWIPLEGDNATRSTFFVRFRVTATDGQFDEEVVKFTLQEQNRPPVLPAIPAVKTIAGTQLSLSFPAFDGDVPAQSLTWSLSGGPTGNTATIDSATGAFQWKPAPQIVGTTTFQVKVTDSAGGSATRPLVVTVAPFGSAPAISPHLVDDTGSSSSDGITFRPDIAGTLVYAGTGLTAFTASFADAATGTPPVDLLDPFIGDVLHGTGNTRTFSLDLPVLQSIRVQQNLGGIFPDGSYTLRLQATDAAGRTTNPPATITFTLDTTSPTAPTGIDLAPEFKNSDGTANAQVVSIVGLAEPNSLVVINNQFQGAASAAGVFVVPNVQLNGPNTPTDILVFARDTAGNDSSGASTTFTYRTNVPLTLDVAGTGGFRGERRAFALTASDTHSPAGWKFEIDWDGNQVFEETSTSATPTKTVTHVYNQSGTANAVFKVTDLFTNAATTFALPIVTTDFAVRPNDFDPGLTDLLWGGTPWGDRVFFAKGASDGEVTVLVSIENGKAANKSFVVPGINGRIVANGYAGADTLNAENVIDQGTILFGGGGDDALTGGLRGDWLDGGDGNDNLLGGTKAGDGADTLLGGTGRDLLFGHYGLDVLTGKEGEDIVVSDAINFGANWASALFAIRGEWASERSYAERAANILGVGAGPRNNGNFFLQPGATVLNDGSVDALIAGPDLDWIIIRVGQDLFADLQAGETLTST